MGIGLAQLTLLDIPGVRCRSKVVLREAYGGDSHIYIIYKGFGVPRPGCTGHEMHVYALLSR